MAVGNIPIHFDQTGGTSSFTYSFGSCKAKNNKLEFIHTDTWLSVSKDDTLINLTAGVNNDPDRETDVEIYLNNNHCGDFIVTQDGLNCSCNDETFNAEGVAAFNKDAHPNAVLGSYTASTDCITNVEVINGSAMPEWLTNVNINTSDKTITGNILANTSSEARNPVTINLRGTLKPSGTCDRSITVNQNGTSCKCGDSTFKITTASPIQKQSEGGNFEFSYIASDCVTSVSNPTVSSGGEGWISGLELLASGKKVTGTVSSYSEATPRSATITIKGTLQDGTTECPSSISIEQTGVNKCKCTDIDEITFITLSDTGYTATTNVIGHWSKKSTSTCTGIPTITSTDLPSIAANNDGTITIGSLADNPDFKEKSFTVSITYNGDDCGTRKIKQDGKLKCDCQHADYFIRTLKTSFNFYGTGGQTQLIGSGKTSCGSIKLITDSDMIEGRELTVEPLSDGEFNIKANVLPSTETRYTGIEVELYDEEGELIDKCNTSWILSQSPTACVCGNWPQPSGILGGDSRVIWDKLNKEYWIDASNPSNFSFTFYSPGSEPCKAGYVDYDESLWTTNSFEYHHWLHSSLTPSNIALFAKQGVADDGPVHTTVNVTWYADVEFHDGEMTTGFPCETMTYNFVIWDGTCDCFIECNYYVPLNPYTINIGAEANWTSGYGYTYCDDTELRYELSFETGVEPWAMVEASPDDSKIWILTYEANNTESSRSVDILEIPIVNGEECDCNNYAAHISQEYDECVNCEVAMKRFYSKDETITPRCDQSSLINLTPTRYSDKCGYDVYEIKSATPESALTHVTTIGVNTGITITGLSEQTEDWVFTYDTFIGKNVNNQWVPVFEDCKRTQTLTIKKCVPEGCSCNNRSTQYSFTKETIQENYPNNFGRLKIGTVGIISPEDSCLKYEAVSTQPSFVTTESIDPTTREVYVNIGDIGDNTSVDVALTVNLRDFVNDIECQGGEPISFHINKNL